MAPSGSSAWTTKTASWPLPPTASSACATSFVSTGAPDFCGPHRMLTHYEVMTGVERRRRWSDEEKLSILGEVGVGGETVAGVARRHDITRQHIYQWRREMRRKGLMSPRDPMLVPVEVAEEAVADTGDDRPLSSDPVEVV